MVDSPGFRYNELSQCEVGYEHGSGVSGGPSLVSVSPRPFRDVDDPRLYVCSLYLSLIYVNVKQLKRLSYCRAHVATDQLKQAIRHLV